MSKVGQQTHEEMFNITSNQGNANQSYTGSRYKTRGAQPGAL